MGLGLLANLRKLGSLSVGLDYRARNDVEGKSALSLSFTQPVGPGALIYGVDKTGAINLSFLTLF